MKYESILFSLIAMSAGLVRSAPTANAQDGLAPVEQFGTPSLSDSPSLVARAPITETTQDNGPGGVNPVGNPKNNDKIRKFFSKFLGCKSM